MSVNYIQVPFASGGDQTVVPIPTQGSGAASMTQGYGPDYAKSLVTDPAALAIDRAQMNYLWAYIFGAVQAIQQYGIPLWISASDNGGTPFPYAANVPVRYTDGNLYLSLVASNTVTPGTDPTKWELIAFDFNPMPQVTIVGSAPHTTAMVSNTCYLVNNTALETLSLPLLPADSDEIKVIGNGSGGWKITQTVAGSTQRIGAIISTAGTGGYSYSTNQYDGLSLKYSSSLTAWIATAIPGNPAVH